VLRPTERAGSNALEEELGKRDGRDRALIPAGGGNKAGYEFQSGWVRHAELVTDARLATLLPSLCLNLAESYRLAGRTEESGCLGIRLRCWILSFSIVAMP
jgi:hypothetical protein